MKQVLEKIASYLEKKEFTNDQRLDVTVFGTELHVFVSNFCKISCELKIATSKPSDTSLLGSYATIYIMKQGEDQLEVLPRLTAGWSTPAIETTNNTGRIHCAETIKDIAATEFLIASMLESFDFDVVSKLM
ncbi:hypothetical protein [Photobacterium kishitanii]|uniref:Uncharacterized protein n=1 Tax=Photobacterium kishitanii TaxID=318456 RepID=A0A2T3KLE3_9GAMM|nr:hypothetical protein [Photobacterium kishitanii]PSV00479.1 hypothetical protein C9J27_04925 [Photobacterium kishitanii]